MKNKFNLTINIMGYVVSLLVGISLFLSEKFENNVLIPLLLLVFVIAMFSKENRKKFLNLRQMSKVGSMRNPPLLVRGRVVE